MNQSISKPTIIWILQNNQVSPIIIDFLKILKKGLGKVNLQFLVPDGDDEAIKLTQELQPLIFGSTRIISARSLENYIRKRDLISNGKFPDGLTYWQTLIMDDFGEGLISETTLALPLLKNVMGIILQIPTPLGSATKEEFLFNAWVRTAHQNKVFIAGYELLSLATRWTLIPSMLDGIITTNEMSFNHLSHSDQKIKGKIWKLPLNEGKTFSPGTSVLWRNGLESPYHYRSKYNIALHTSMLFIAHNVAMSYEFKRLLEEIEIYADKIHLMFCVGKDQIRGTHSHEETIKTICKNTLKKFKSYSFHSLNAPWEMTAADAVLACSNCYNTIVAEANGIPCLVMDDSMPETEQGHLKIVNSYQKMRSEIQKIIELRNLTTDLTNIIYELLNKNVGKIHN